MLAGVGYGEVVATEAGYRVEEAVGVSVPDCKGELGKKLRGEKKSIMIREQESGSFKSGIESC